MQSKFVSVLFTRLLMCLFIGLLVGAMALGGDVARAASAEKMKHEAAEAASAAAEYALESKEEFSRKMRANLAAVEADISHFKSQATVASGDIRKNLAKRIGDLEEKRDEMKMRLAKITSSSGRAWEKMRSGVERAWSEVASAYKKAAVEFDADELDDAGDRKSGKKRN